MHKKAAFRRPPAGEQGFEPQLTDSESAVLPLDDSPLVVGPLLNHEKVYQSEPIDTT